MLIELVGLELRKTAQAFWLYSDGLIILMLGKDCLRIFVGMFLDESFESHWLLPQVFRDGMAFLGSIHLLSLI